MYDGNAKHGNPKTQFSADRPTDLFYVWGIYAVARYLGCPETAHPPTPKHATIGLTVYGTVCAKRIGMTKDPTSRDIPSDTATVQALLQQVELYGRNLADMQQGIGKLTNALATRLGQPARPLPGVPEPKPVHPVEAAILATLGDGRAHLKTELAAQTGASRSTVHYHCKRLQIERKILEIGSERGRHATDYVILREACPVIPGLDDAQPKGGPSKA